MAQNILILPLADQLCPCSQRILITVSVLVILPNNSAQQVSQILHSGSQLGTAFLRISQINEQ